jgi:putative membrane protein
MSEPVTKGSSDPSIATELAMRRTGMSFQRTRMSADRTLMAVIRTSLSLISFGFTIFQFFKKLKDSGALSGSAPARNFGLSLVWLGIAMLMLGIIYHVMYMLGLRGMRDELHSAGVIHAQSQFPPSLTLIVALALLAIGWVAVLGLVFHVGPFG